MEVREVKSSFPRSTIYSSAVGAAIERQQERRGASVLSQIAASALGEAITEDVSSYHFATQCMYFVRPDDQNIADIVYKNSLNDFGSAFNGGVVDFGPDGQPLEIAPQEQQPLADKIAFAQTCSDDLQPGQSVMMTVSISGTTLHPIE